MNISCPHCASRLTIDEKIIASTGGGPCPACGKILAIKLPTEVLPVHLGAPPHPAVANLAPTTSNKTGLIMGGAAGAVSFVVLTALLVALLGAKTPRDEGNYFSFQRTQAQLEQLRQDIKEKEQELKEKAGELREANESLNQVKDHENDLQRKCDALEDQLANLITRLEALDRWKHANCVLVNPHSFAVGFQEQDGRFRVISKAEGRFQQDAVGWAKKADRPVIDKDPELTRRIFAEVDLGEVVPENLAKEIKRHWQPPRFVPVSPDEKNPMMVVFQDAERGGRHVGLLLGNDAEQLRIREVAPENDTIPRSRIQIGTVRAAPGDKILSSLNDGDFLDYCVLRAAQNLGARDGRSGIVRVAVQVEVEALKEFLELSKRPDTRLTDELFEFWARLHEKPYPRDARKEPVRLLREIAMYVEDEVYDKLTKLGVPVVERQQIQAVVEESRFGLPLSSAAQQEITQLGATHMLIVDVKKSQNGGRYHLATRLTEIRHGEVLWAQSGDRLEPLPNVQQRFLLRTGRLALVTVNAGSQERFQGVEDPPVALPATMGMKAGLQHLVFVESDDKQTLTYRPLFGIDRHEISRQAISRIDWIDKDMEVPTAHQVRYMVWKLAAAILPAAGRVTNIRGDNAQITLGLRHGIKHHDTLYVLRNIAPLGMNGSAAPTLLGTTLNVTEIHDGSSRVIISGSGLQGWEEDEGLQPDDLVITKAGRPVSIAMLAPAWQEPTQITKDIMELSNPVLMQRAIKATLQTSLALKNVIGTGLRSTGVPVFTEFGPESILETGATHIFWGGIRPTKSNCFHVEAMIFPLNESNLGLIHQPKIQIPRFGQELIRVQADINQSSLK